MKNWIIRKLGGIVGRDLPLRIQQGIFNHYINATIDKNYYENPKEHH